MGASILALTKSMYYICCFHDNVWTEENGVFRIKRCPTSYSTYTFKRCGISIVLAFSCGRAQKKPIRYLFVP